MQKYQFRLVLLTLVCATNLGIIILHNHVSELKQWLIRSHRIEPKGLNLTIEYFKRPNLVCKGVFEGDKNALLSTEFWYPKPKFTSEVIAHKITKDCKGLQYHFNQKPISQEEKEFPFAYILNIQNQLNQALLLLKTIYVPQNVYCLTYDAKEPHIVKETLRNIANCFPNIILPKRFEKIYWGHFSVLKNVLNCMEVLNSKDWRYVQILSWSDMPLKTNSEMVKILKIFNGSNDVALGQDYLERYEYSWVMKPPHYKPTKDGEWALEIYDYYTAVTNLYRPKPNVPGVPGKVTEKYKGSFAATLSHAFVNFTLQDPLPQSIIDWSNDTLVPDEFLWTTLTHNPQLGAPGSFPGKCLRFYELRKTVKQTVSRYQAWDTGGKHRKPCYSHFRTHGSCVFGVRDLQLLNSVPHLVAHKIYYKVQPAAFYCMLQRLEDQTASNGHVYNVDYNFYRDLPAVKYKANPERCPP